MGEIPEIALIEQVRLWLSVLLGPLVTLVGFAFIYKQLGISGRAVEVAGRQAATSSEMYRLSVEAADRVTRQATEQQNWKKAEFLANQVKDFYGDETVEKVTFMLDWHMRKINLIDDSDRKVLAVHDDDAFAKARDQESLREEFIDKNIVVVIARALREHDGDDPFTELEVLVRDNFDWFFFRLGQFQHMIQSGLFTYQEVEIHLSYVLDLVSGGLNNVSPKLVEAIAHYVDRYDFPAVKKLISCRIEIRKTVGQKANG
jgi:hypothetical protein